MDFTLSSPETVQTLSSLCLSDGQACQVVLLSPSHAGLISAFHEAVIKHLNQNEKSFIFPKTRSYFEDHLSRGSGNAMLGVVGKGNRLLAQAMVLHPDPDSPETGMVDMSPPAPAEDLSVLQAVSVSPAHRGHGLMALMVEHWARHAEKAERGHLLAEIDIKNKASWISFLNRGLDLVGIGVDPADGTYVYNAHEKTVLAREKVLSRVFCDNARRIHCDVQNIPLQKGLFSQGERCTGYEKATNSLVFTLPQLGNKGHYLHNI